MGYLGNTPAESFLSFEKQVFTIVNSQTAYTLNFSVTNENDIRLVINNVIQEPGSGKAYTASGTTLTLSAALTNGTDEMYCVFLGRARETVTVPDIATGNIADDAVTKAKVNFISDGTAGVEVKGDGGSNDGYIQLNCRQNSHGIKLKSPPHSAAQSYTLTFPSTAPATDKFLKTDSSGNLSFATALTNGSESIVKAWCKWTGTTIGDSYNVSSVTNPSTGKYVINFADNMDNANFATVGSIYGQTFANSGFELESQSVDATTLVAKNFGNNTTYNMGSGGYGCVIVIGDNASL